MFSDVQARLNKKNKILFSHDSTCLKELISQMNVQTHCALILWAFDCVRIPLQILEEAYPDEQRPRTAIELCKSWAEGNLKMPTAKRAILQAHAAAKEMQNEVHAALCHAVGQAGATVHVKTHAMGFIFYELTGIVLAHKTEEYEPFVMQKIEFYKQRLSYWQKQSRAEEYQWADFLKSEN